MDCAESGSPVRPSQDSEMKIFVRSEYHGNYALEVDSSNTIQDVLITVLPIWRLEADPEPQLYFNGDLLDRAKSLADYGVEDGSILHLECTNWIFLSANESEQPNQILGRKKIIITDRLLAIWEKEHDKILLGLLVEQIQTGGRKILYLENDSWRDVVAKFNKTTGLKYENKHLYEHFNFYKYEYEIVSNIRHHPEFSWDHRRQVVIATDAKWNEYIKDNPNAKCYRRRAVPFIDLLENVFAKKEE
ncbi:uncharacterized protein LOC109713075 [Ananas comosus]|uniref:Uncharacterized protein LOC109713075 n=1 Tax=Ananas comosus TaxID=4615 RepID=A0A6P5FAJ7_ANACO|nr:uncharacterized protein LOC109713075 [Ananas comosus]